MDQWLPVVGWGGVFSVSDVGRIRCEQDRGGRYHRRAGDMLSPAVGKDGYLVVSLARVGERDGRATRAVHRLVAEAFLGPPPFDGAQVNHRNGCKTDNAVGNLEWVTCAENVRHSIERLGRDLRGENCPRAKLSSADVIEIRQLAAKGATFKDLAVEFGVSNVAIAKAATGQTWGNVSGPLVLPRDAAEKRRLGIPNR